MHEASVLFVHVVLHPHQRLVFLIKNSLSHLEFCTCDLMVVLFTSAASTTKACASTIGK